MTQSLANFAQSEDYEKFKLVWLIRLRWGAIFLFFVLAGPAYIFRYLNAATLPIYIGHICFLFLFNWLTHLLFVESKRSITPFLICFQLALDMLVLFSLLFITKGFENPFVCLILLNVGLAAVLIRGRFSVPFILLSHFLLIALQLNYAFDHSAEIESKNIALVVISHVLVLTTWIVMRSLGHYLESHFENLTLLRVRAEKQDRLRSLGALAAGFSHEFASPLTAAKLQLDRLEKSISNNLAPTNLLEELNEAKASISACETVIQHMNSSQLDVRDFRIKSTSVNSLISDVVDSWKEEHPKAQLKVTLSHEVSLKVAPINFAQVLLNLLDNALDAAKDDLIELSFYIESSKAHLVIEDSGPGFSKTVLERQGEPFITTKPDGTGLGLYVSQLFAQSMNGQLNISNRNKGAKITLTWPAELT